jgi:hypothetical protein
MRWSGGAGSHIMLQCDGGTSMPKIRTVAAESGDMNPHTFHTDINFLQALKFPFYDLLDDNLDLNL